MTLIARDSVQVKWSKENYQHDSAQPYGLVLASADFNGKIIVWNVAQGSIITEFSESSKPVAGLSSGFSISFGIN